MHMNLAFDFEWVNKNIMYGSYERTHSVFQNSEMMAKGEPSPDELALLEPFRSKVPPPKSLVRAWTHLRSATGQGRIANCFAAAGDLLNEAGWTDQGGKRVNAEWRAAF